MKKALFIALTILVSSLDLARAAGLDEIMKNIGGVSRGAPDEQTTASGLKEALEIGTENAVKSVSKTDGYFGNQTIKILMPEKIQKAADVLKKFGYQKEVDDFILSMNRAAEKAAPKAASIFGDAIKKMTVDDARKILGGGDTAATDYFKVKTHDQIYDAFKPIISSSMNEVGVTHSYKTMMSKYESIPFMSKESVDLDHHVTTKAMDGLYYMVGQEEKKIRTDPAARTTDLLKTVFGK
ncbi:MAG TPA: DUF4197 domain-containing protein [Thermodesulfovibrionales bacterium]|jgi:hypothetical protein|nr:DUF4197 domain-containing protein [Thermodesulfovibrionales bacterium]